MRLESMGRTRDRKRPRRSFSEMADEFGISPQRLSRLVGHYGGPKPVLSHHNSLTKTNTWYDPKEMRAWWNSLPEDVRKGVKP